MFTTFLQPKVGWQMFIEPLPSHNGWGEGWCFLCDILLRLPLSIFVKVVNITYEINGLEDYLKHPIKKHLLLKHLPMGIRQGLIYARKYIFTVHDVVTNMVFLGLAQFGPSSLKVLLFFTTYVTCHSSNSFNCRKKTRCSYT